MPLEAVQIDEKAMEVITVPTLHNGSNVTYSMTGNSTDTGDIPCCYPGVERIILPLVFAIIVILGCLGNILVIVVVVKNKDVFRNTTNLFILNLAVADILFVVFCVPFHAFIYTVLQWPFGEFMCKFVHFVQYGSMLASIFTLVAMSVDRFLAVGYPLSTKHIRTPTKALGIAVLIWLVSCAMAAPWLSYYTVRYYPQDGVEACADDWGSVKHHKRIYFLILSLVGYALPFLGILVLSCLLIRQLWSLSGAEGTGRRGSTEAKRKVTRLVIIVVMVFFICWLPTHVFWLGTNYFPTYWKPTYTLYYTRIAAHVFSYANSAVNPVIYAFLSSQFRKGFHRAFTCQRSQFSLSRSSRRPVHGSSISHAHFKWSARTSYWGHNGGLSTTAAELTAM